MKSLVFSLIAAVAPAFAAEGWLTNIDKGVEQAKKDNKLVLVEFTGSDWCPPCIALKKDVFPSKEFEAIADKSLVLVELDFPRTKEKQLTPDQAQYNESMRKKYGVTGFPSVYLFNDNGQPVWMRVGGGAKEEYLASLKKGIDNAKTITDNLNAAQKAEGMEKATLLDKAYKAMSPDLQEKNVDILKQIVALDKDNTLGYSETAKGKDQEKDIQAFVDQTLIPLVREEKFDDAIAKAKEYAAKPELTKLNKQMIHMALIPQFYIGKGDVDAGIQAMKDGIAMDPNVPQAKIAQENLKEMEANKEQFKKQIEQAKAAQAKLKAEKAADKASSK